MRAWPVRAGVRIDSRCFGGKTRKRENEKAGKRELAGPLLSLSRFPALPLSAFLRKPGRRRLNARHSRLDTFALHRHPPPAMNRIVERFAELKKRGQKGFVVYLGAGDPHLEATRQLT